MVNVLSSLEKKCHLCSMIWNILRHFIQGELIWGTLLFVRVWSGWNFDAVRRREHPPSRVGYVVSDTVRGLLSADSTVGGSLCERVSEEGGQSSQSMLMPPRWPPWITMRSFRLFGYFWNFTSVHVRLKTGVSFMFLRILLLLTEFEIFLWTSVMKFP